jgi:hypothetical protein
VIRSPALTRARLQWNDTASSPYPHDHRGFPSGERKRLLFPGKGSETRRPFFWRDLPGLPLLLVGPSVTVEAGVILPEPGVLLLRRFEPKRF